MSKVKATLEARDLRAIDKVIYQAPEEELIARKLFNLKTDIPVGAETYGYNVMTRSGVAKIIANNADDIPMVDTDMKRYETKLFSIWAGVHYSLTEIRSARLTGTNVDAVKSEAARRAIAEKENKVFFKGDANHGIQGVLNAEGIVVSEAGKKFAVMTGVEKVEFLRSTRKEITTIPGMRGAKLALILTPDAFEDLDTPFDTTHGAYTTVRQVIEGRGWFSSIEAATDLEDFTATNVDSLVIMGTSPLTAEIPLVQDITRHTPEEKLTGVKVAFEEITGAPIIRMPYTILRVDNV